MREQREILMHIANSAFPDSDTDSLFRVVKFFAAHGDATFVRVSQAGNAIEQRRFARARSAEENRESRQRAQVDIQDEAAFDVWKALPNADFEFGGNRLR